MNTVTNAQTSNNVILPGKLKNAYNNFLVSLKKHEKSDVKVEAKPAVIELSKQEVSVVYDKFDVESFFAAAVFSGRTIAGSLNEYSVLDNTSVLYLDVSEIITIGIKLKGKTHFGMMAEKNKCKLVEMTNASKQPGLAKRIEAYVNSIGRPASLYEEALLRFEQPAQNSSCLGHMLKRFYNMDLTPQELVYLYKNYEAAKHAIETGTRFEALPFTYDLTRGDAKEFMQGNDWQEYRGFIKRVQGKLRNQCRIMTYKVGEKLHKYCFSAMNFDDYVWALRIIRASHKQYLNISVSTEGYLYSTNVASVESLHLKENFRSAGSI